MLHPLRFNIAMSRKGCPALGGEHQPLIIIPPLLLQLLVLPFMYAAINLTCPNPPLHHPTLFLEIRVAFQQQRT